MAKLVLHGVGAFLGSGDGAKGSQLLKLRPWCPHPPLRFFPSPVLHLNNDSVGLYDIFQLGSSRFQ